MAKNRELTFAPNQNELAWLAGLLEGEGCFYLAPDRKRLAVKVSMSDVDVIKRVGDIFGGLPPRGYEPSNPRDKRDRKTMYEVSLSGHQAAQVMYAVLPYMGMRRSLKIRECFNLWNPNKIGKGYCKGCRQWLEEYRAIGA